MPASHRAPGNDGGNGGSSEASGGAGATGSGGSATSHEGGSDVDARSSGGSSSGGASSSGSGGTRGSGGASNGGTTSDEASVNTDPGNLVLIGHTFDSNNTEDEKVLENALFVGGGSGPLRILEYTEGLSDGYNSVATPSVVHPFITSYAKTIGRTAAFTALTDYRNLWGRARLGRRPARLRPSCAESGQDEVIAHTWGPDVTAFLGHGGTVVVLDAAERSISSIPTHNASPYRGRPRSLRPIDRDSVGGDRDAFRRDADRPDRFRPHFSVFPRRPNTRTIRVPLGEPS